MADKELQEIMERVKGKLVKSKAEIEAHEQGITQTTDRIKKEILKHTPEQEQKIFSFLPTEMTRISPFFPLNKREMKDRPLEELTWEHNWGRFTVTGKKLSVYDESVLLAVLVLMRKNQKETFQTTRHELCRVMNVTPCQDTYRAVWASLSRLTKTGIDLMIWSKKIKGKKRKVKKQMVNTILSGAEMDENTGKIIITINPYFIRMYGESFITNLDLKFRSQLSGDITKALYRFLEGQREAAYQCHLLTLAKAINLNVEMETKLLRYRIRQGLRELKKQGYLIKWNVSKTDIIMTEKKKKNRNLKALPVKD